MDQYSDTTKSLFSMIDNDSTLFNEHQTHSNSMSNSVKSDNILNQKMKKSFLSARFFPGKENYYNGVNIKERLNSHAGIKSKDPLKIKNLKNILQTHKSCFQLTIPSISNKKLEILKKSIEVSFDDFLFTAFSSKLYFCLDENLIPENSELQFNGIPKFCFCKLEIYNKNPSKATHNLRIKIRIGQNICSIISNYQTFGDIKCVDICKIKSQNILDISYFNIDNAKKAMNINYKNCEYLEDINTIEFLDFFVRLVLIQLIREYVYKSKFNENSLKDQQFIAIQKIEKGNFDFWKIHLKDVRNLNDGFIRRSFNLNCLEFHILNTQNISNYFLDPIPSGEKPLKSLYSYQNIEVEKILLGDDTRTTLMVKNIPNRFDLSNLLEMLNENYLGCYDFVYLPIDFSNKCNIGYAFVNFKKAKHVITFFYKNEGKKWDAERSEKIISISYARIQGRYSLLRHFKRSNVMGMDISPSFKPFFLCNEDEDKQ